MAKNGMLFIFIITIIVGGIAYTVVNDSEQPARELVKLTLKEFAKNAAELESQYLTDSLLTDQRSQFIVTLENEGIIEEISVKMTVQDNKVTLLYTNESLLLAGQTVVLEPFKKGEQVRWFCINGNVLVRLRDKECRIGNGILTSEFL